MYFAFYVDVYKLNLTCKSRKAHLRVVCHRPPRELIVAVNSLVLPCPRSPFSFFGICARHPFYAVDALTILSSHADRSKLKRVNRPIITDSLSMLRLYNWQCAFTLARHADCIDTIIRELSKNWPHIFSAVLTLS